MQKACQIDAARFVYLIVRSRDAFEPEMSADEDRFAPIPTSPASQGRERNVVPSKDVNHPMQHHDRDPLPCEAGEG